MKIRWMCCRVCWRCPPPARVPKVVVMDQVSSEMGVVQGTIQEIHHLLLQKGEKPPKSCLNLKHMEHMPGGNTINMAWSIICQYLHSSDLMRSAVCGHFRNIADEGVLTKSLRSLPAPHAGVQMLMLHSTPFLSLLAVPVGGPESWGVALPNMVKMKVEREVVNRINNLRRHMSSVNKSKDLVKRYQFIKYVCHKYPPVDVPEAEMMAQVTQHVLRVRKKMKMHHMMMGGMHLLFTVHK